MKFSHYLHLPAIKDLNKRKPRYLGILHRKLMYCFTLDSGTSHMTASNEIGDPDTMLPIESHVSEWDLISKCAEDNFNVLKESSRQYYTDNSIYWGNYEKILKDFVFSTYSNLPARIEKFYNDAIKARNDVIEKGKKSGVDWKIHKDYNYNDHYVSLVFAFDVACNFFDEFSDNLVDFLDIMITIAEYEITESQENIESLRKTFEIINTLADIILCIDPLRLFNAPLAFPGPNRPFSTCRCGP